MANGALQGGGAERVIATLSRHLVAHGHRVSVVALSSGGEVLDELEAQGFEILPSPSGHGISGLWSTATRLRDLVRERRVDVVHTHDVRSLVEVGTSRRLTRAFAHVHTFHFGNYPHLPAKPLWLERLFSRAPDRLVAVGHHQAEALGRVLGVSRQRFSIVWNGVDAPADVAPLASGRAVPVIGSVSAFFEQKGIPVLLEAARLLRQRGYTFHLMLVGDGPLRAELERTVHTTGLADTVTFAGWRPDAARTVLPTIDLFVQSSHWEAMSIVLLEAMAARCPIVATSVGDNPLVIEHERTGVLVPPGRPDALADGLARLLDDPLLRQRLALAARESYEVRFTAEGMARRYEALYAELQR
jgi:glycosyltransferase involved in cell wall biosynthesis